LETIVSQIRDDDVPASQTAQTTDTPDILETGLTKDVGETETATTVAIPNKRDTMRGFRNHFRLAETREKYLNLQQQMYIASGKTADLEAKRDLVDKELNEHLVEVASITRELTNTKYLAEIQEANYQCGAMLRKCLMEEQQNDPLIKNLYPDFVAFTVDLVNFLRTSNGIFTIHHLMNLNGSNNVPEENAESTPGMLIHIYHLLLDLTVIINTEKIEIAQPYL